jgi:predicted RNA-binding protein with TRAM domain
MGISPIVSCLLCALAAGASGCLTHDDTFIPCKADWQCPSGFECSVTQAAGTAGTGGYCQASQAPDASLAIVDAGQFINGTPVYSAVEGYNQITAQISTDRQLDEVWGDGSPVDTFGLFVTGSPDGGFTTGMFQSTAPNYTGTYKVTGSEHQGPQQVVVATFENGSPSQSPTDAGVWTSPILFDFTKPTINTLSTNGATLFSSQTSAAAHKQINLSIDNAIFQGATATATATITTGGPAIPIPSDHCTPNATFSHFDCTYSITGTETLGAAIISATVVDQVGNVSTSTSAMGVGIDIADVPAAPAVMMADAGNQSVELTWNEPAENGSSITSYTITPTPGASGTPVTVASSAVGSPPSYTVTGLTNGTGYTFTVLATNAVGDGPASAATSELKPATTPDAPVTPTAVFGDGKAMVTWAAPCVAPCAMPSDEGRPISGYTIKAYPGDGSATLSMTATPAMAGMPFTFSGLTNGVSYTFTVTAANVIGTGEESMPSTPAVTPGRKPDPPAAPHVVPGNSMATVTVVPVCVAPCSVSGPSDEGRPVTSYTVTETTTNTSKTLPQPGPLAVTFTGLKNGTTFSFVVTATNAINTSDPSSATSAKPANIPDPPTIGMATAGNGSATVTWTALCVTPTSTCSGPNDEGNGVTSYTVTAAPGGATKTVPGANAATATVTGLTNGISYTFTVTATSGTLNSSASVASNAVTPATKPDAPIGVSATAGNAMATVMWTANCSTPSCGANSYEGSAITSYTVTTSPATQPPKTVPAGTACTSTPCMTAVSGLTNGVAYTFTVVATNVLGDSLSSQASTAVTPQTVPDAPTGVMAMAGTNGVSATVSWTAPNNEGSGITSYTVTSSPDPTHSSGVVATVNGTPPLTMVTVMGLTPGETYTFTVTATNGKGTGAASSPSSQITLPNVPGAPTAVMATAGIRQATVTWIRPTDNGGSPVMSYIVTTSPGGQTTGATGSLATITGLSNGQTYSFKVQAVNAVGTGAASVSSNFITTPNLPNAPTNIMASLGTVTPSSGQATVSWHAPTSDDPILSYLITTLPGGATVVITAPATSGTVASLTDGTTYTFTVAATSDVGTGSASAVSAGVTPASVPAAPTMVMATPSGSPSLGQIVVNWTAPAATGGSSITSYTITPTGGNATAMTISGTPPSPTVTFVNLEQGQSYSFAVAATNATGSSMSATTQSAVTIPLDLNWAQWVMPSDMPATTEYSASGGTVSDGTTGLTWSNASTTPSGTFSTAQTACTALGTGDFPRGSSWLRCLTSANPARRS